jgi:hypothetical protein
MCKPKAREAEVADSGNDLGGEMGDYFEIIKTDKISLADIMTAQCR